MSSTPLPFRILPCDIFTKKTCNFQDDELMEDDSQLQDCGITNAVAKAQLPSEVGLAFRYYRI